MDEERTTLIGKLFSPFGLIGMVGLVAWFALLWFMFGDVL